MAERDLIERLDTLIGAILAGVAAPAVDPELTRLSFIAADLRDLPDPEFKSRLRNELVPNQEDIVKSTAVEVSLRPHLMVDGVDDLIAFLERTFDAEVLLRVPAPGGKVLHAEVRLGDSVLELADVFGQWKPLAAPLHVYLENVDEIYGRAIAAGATSLYEPTNQSYGDREGGFVDSWGIEWFVARRLEGGPRPPGYETVTTGFRAAGAQRLLGFLTEAFGAVHLSGTTEHAEIRLGRTILELSEAHGRWGATRGGFHLVVDDCDAVYNDAIRAGATSLYPPADKPYGERAAGVTDPWGNQWYIGTPLG